MSNSIGFSNQNLCAIILSMKTHIPLPESDQSPDKLPYSRRDMFDPKLANELLSHIWAFTKAGWTIQIEPPGRRFKKQRVGFCIILFPPTFNQKISDAETVTPRDAVNALSCGVLAHPILAPIYLYNLEAVVSFFRAQRIIFVRE